MPAALSAPVESRDVTWNTALLQGAPELESVAHAARAFAAEPAWPDVTRWNAIARAAGLADPGVRFVPFPRQTRVSATRYDASIVETRQVLCRAESWHDLCNALVWLTYPESKWVLHRRQLAARQSEHPALARGHRRGRERDALALFDEGGVVRHRGAVRIFGHALIEQAITGPRPLRALALDVNDEVLDRGLAALLSDPHTLVDPAAHAREWINAG